MTSYQDGTGKGTKYQLRWFNSIVDILAQNWEFSPQKKLARSLAPSKGAGSLVKTQSSKPSRKEKQDQVKQAILANLTDELGNPLSNREIARRCGVSHPFVSKLRKKLFPPKS